MTPIIGSCEEGLRENTDSWVIIVSVSSAKAIVGAIQRSDSAIASR